MTDDPGNFARVARQMAAFAVGSSKTHPWWALGSSVAALMDVATDEDNPLAEPATVALQIMSAVFNERVGDGID